MTLDNILVITGAGRPEHIAAAAAFLESDAVAFISGCDIRVDGGIVGAGKHLMGVG